MAEEPKSKKDDTRIAEQAAGWVARLQSSDATDEDRRRFEEWLERDPAHREAFEEFRELWGDLKDVPVPPDRLKKLKNARRRASVLRGGALALLVVFCASFYQSGYIDRMRADYYTSVGEVRTITLDDGSQVDLNTDTAITVDYSDSARRIRILHGEAYFSVAKNPQRPFIVSSDDLTATAVGTQYAVSAQSDGDDVQVEEGRVEVHAGTERVLLEAGFAALLGDHGHLSVVGSAVGNATAWRAGRLIFSDQPLRKVLATLARYRHDRIVIVDEDAAEQKVSGIFDLNDTDGALREIESSLPVAVTPVAGLLVIVRSRSP